MQRFSFALPIVVLFLGLFAFSQVVSPAIGKRAVHSPAPLPSLKLFEENFESGGPGWTVEGDFWHVAANAQCSSVTKTAAYNRWPAACNYFVSGASEGSFTSPPFVISGISPVGNELTVSFTYTKDMDAGEIVSFFLVDAFDNGIWSSLPGPYGSNTSTPQPVTLTVPNLGFWWGRTAALQAVIISDGIDDQGLGFNFDNVLAKKKNF